MAINTTTGREAKNIWIAAGDGDLERVRVRELCAIRAIKCIIDGG
jgi:hypothetical protein